MAKAKAKPASKPAQPAVTKTEAVRQVLSELGKKAPVDAALSLVKEKFGLEIGKSHFFNIKSVLGLGRGKGKKRGRPAKAEAAATPAPSVASAARSRGAAAFAFADIAILADLVARLGTSDLHSLVDVLS